MKTAGILLAGFKKLVDADCLSKLKSIEAVLNSSFSETKIFQT